MRELSSYIYEQVAEAAERRKKVKDTNGIHNDLVLLCGDLNISRSEMSQLMGKRLLKEHSGYSELITELNMEYRICRELLSQGDKNVVIDLLE